MMDEKKWAEAERSADRSLGMAIIFLAKISVGTAVAISVARFMGVDI